MQSIGIEFRNDAMVLAVFSQGIRDVRLIEHRVVPFLDVSAEERDSAIQLTLEQFFRDHKSGRDNVYMCLPRDAVLVRFVPLPLAVEENLRETLEFEIDRHTPFSSDDVYFDHQVVGRYPESGQMQVMLVVVRRTLIQERMELFRRLHARLRGIEISTTALLNALHTPVRPPAALPGAGLLQAVPAIDQLVRTRAPRLHAAATAAAQTQDEPGVDILVNWLDSTRYELAVARGAALFFSTVATVPGSKGEVPFADIHARGTHALVHLPCCDVESVPVRMVLTGREFEPSVLEGAPEDLRDCFALPGTLPITDSRGTGTPESPSQFAAVVGLGLKGLQVPVLDINLIPPPQRPRRKRSKRKLVAALGGAVLLAAVALVCARYAWDLNMRHRILNEQLAELRTEVAKIEDLQLELEGIGTFAHEIEAIRSTSVSKLVLLEEVTRLLPRESWLTQFDYDGPDNRIRLSGFATSASELISILEDSPVFANVKFTSPITTDRRSGKEKFRLEMQVQPQQAEGSAT